MPVDARSLLRASTASSASGSHVEGAPTHRAIVDRFASYHPKTRALRCSACDYQIVKHESLWASHTASKTHRSNVQAIKRREEEQARRDAESSAISEKSTAPGKRKQENEQAKEVQEVDTMKRARREGAGPSDEALSQIDSEWERFQAEVLDASANGQSDDSKRYINAGATIEVEPMLKNQMDDDGVGEDEADELVETPAEKQARLEQEEREDIIARLEEEQRLQEEADERASALRARFEAMRRARGEKRRE